jgi:histidine triad (HIT) family protein/ATP adenylyltransferase
MGNEPAKMPFDLEQYARRVSEGPCFVCGFVEGRPDHYHHLVYEDDDTVAFLSRYPALLGYCLVAPKRHLESWVHDMDPQEFLRFQSVVHAVARAIAATVPTERMYSMSLGSQQGNAHLHWHLAPLPPGIPSDRQQFHAVMAENGILAVDADSQAALAGEISNRIQI